MSEATLTRNIIAALRKAGVYVVKVHQTGYGVAGIPDILACADGKFVALEVKDGGRKPTPAQQANILAIRQAGGRAEIVRTVQEALYWTTGRRDTNASRGEVL